MTTLAEQFAVEAWPRTLAERYRIVRLDGSTPITMATSPDAGGIGLALVTLGDEGELAGYAIGVFDTRPGKLRGRWLISPWAGREEAAW